MTGYALQFRSNDTLRINQSLNFFPLRIFLIRGILAKIRFLERNFLNYLIVFLISMVPLIELRGAIPIALGMGLPTLTAYVICVIGNMIPVPFIYFFARKVLIWGADKKYTAKFFTFCLEKGERAGRKLARTAGRRGLFIALMLFVGIPLPGTGAWTGALGASFLNMGFKSTVASVSLGVIMAGVIMGTITGMGLHIFGL